MDLNKEIALANNDRSDASWHGTTVLCVRVGDQVAMAADGQVTLGNMVVKHTATKVRSLAEGRVLVGFAGATADAMTLFERLEAMLERFPHQLTRACVELAKDWRTDRALRRLEAMLIVCDATTTLMVSGNGDVLAPDDNVVATGLRRWIRLSRSLSPATRGSKRRGCSTQGYGHSSPYLHIHQ